MANPLLFFFSNEIAGGRNCSSRIIDRISFNDDETLMIVVDARERTLIGGRGGDFRPGLLTRFEAKVSKATNELRVEGIIDT